MSNIEKTAITADPHFGHANILRLCNREFANISEHDMQIVNRYNSLITDDSFTVWNLGDIGFRCSAYYVTECLSQLNGQIKIILGNHDKPLRQAYKKGLLNKLIKNGKLEIIGGDIILDKSIAISKMIIINGQNIFLSHYSYRTWPSAFRKTWHLYGHSHGNLADHYRSFDVGVDTNNYYPYLMTDIFKRMKAKNVEFSEK